VLKVTGSSRPHACEIPSSLLLLWTFKPTIHFTNHSSDGVFDYHELNCRPPITSIKSTLLLSLFSPVHHTVYVLQQTTSFPIAIILFFLAKRTVSIISLLFFSVQHTESVLPVHQTPCVLSLHCSLQYNIHFVYYHYTVLSSTPYTLCIVLTLFSPVHHTRCVLSLHSSLQYPIHPVYCHYPVLSSTPFTLCIVTTLFSPEHHSRCVSITLFSPVHHSCRAL
jgi:hypothetical protein